MMRPQTRSLKSELLKATCLLLLSFVFQIPSLAFGQGPAIPKFALRYWDVPGRGSADIGISAMNNLGQIVGSTTISQVRRQFIYSPKINPSTAIYFEDAFGNAGIPDGWKWNYVYDINDHGIMVGTLATIDPDPTTGNHLRRGFILDTLAPQPSVVLLPELDGILEYIPSKINNQGDMVGRYVALDGITGWFFFNPAEHDELIRVDLLDPYRVESDESLLGTLHLGDRVNGFAMVGGQYATRGSSGNYVYRCFPELGTFEVSTLPGRVRVHDMNSHGALVGYSGDFYTASHFPIRIDGSQIRTINLSRKSAWDINDTGDVVIEGGYMYRDDRGVINLTSYLSGTKSDINRWKSARFNASTLMNDRGSVSKYGQVAGVLTIDVNGVTQKQAYLLTPIVR